ncbi:bifunctional 2-polyprenyl-6-hydroxyphenol methylase/3-demethylubiquinol 3-O-methyltransferase UbiG [Candidatus Profftia tarda]|nr:bifunctional 2-polyprenyl-6-hydroxyphenol methylase/3-demethylubiquinol 3-O-methyltransferase UbiG [Candidatus Profftia tarda]
MAKFKDMASRWWDLEGDCRALHRINPLRLTYIQDRSEGIFGKKILDVGVGGGILAESMALEGADVTGLDMCEEPLRVAYLHSLETGVKVNYLQSTVEQHAKETEHLYDVVTCMEMLEHVPDPRSIVLACAKLVKPSGHVFFSTINRKKFSWLLVVLGGEYILKLVPKGTHNIKKLIRPSELINWIDETSLRECNVIGVCYNPFTDHFQLGLNLDVNYMMHTVRHVT